MLTPIEAEELANAKLKEYVDGCKCNTVEDVGNVIMKLVSVCGLALCATQGQDKAVAMLDGTAKHIAKPEFKKKWTMSVMH